MQQLVWAFGITMPSNSSSSADLEQHLDAGPFTLNLTKSLDVPDTLSPTPTSSTVSSASSNTSLPSTSSILQDGAHDMTLTAHAVLCFLGFLVILPLSTLLARWTRTRTTNWFRAHWVLNTVVGLPVVIIGWLLGPLSVSRQNRVHVVNEHQVSIIFRKQWSFFLACPLTSNITDPLYRPTIRYLESPCLLST